MATILDLPKLNYLDLGEVDRHNLIRQLRASRRVSKKAVRAAKVAKAAKTTKAQKLATQLSPEQLAQLFQEFNL